MNRPFYLRELRAYPVGGRRVWLLIVALMANIIANYESQMSSVVPLLLSDLHMTLKTYGLIVAVSTIAGAFSAYIAGRLSDRRGRVYTLVPSLFLSSLCVYAMVLVHSPMGLLLNRVILSLVEGSAVIATAGLVRDFSPRLGRAVAYAFWTFGPVGSSFVAAGLAGWTLPIWGTWQSQFWLNGTISLVLSFIVLFSISDISPQLRAEVIHSTASLVTVNGRRKPEQTHAGDPGRTRELLRAPHIWAHLLGITFWLSAYYTLTIFGSTMITQEFGYSAATAASIMKYFWLLNLVVMIAACYISDKLQLRKIVSFVGAVTTAATLIYFINMMGTHPSIGKIELTGAILGACMGIAYAPWMALFSENLEDIKASLQATGWGVFGLSVRVMVAILSVVAPIVVAALMGWTLWFWIVTVGEMLFIPSIFAMKGPWFVRPKLDSRLSVETPLEQQAFVE
ncbi:MFS transporter [Alicyclobacillus ferrooxydans]|uniref:Major facilitator superfamily (MFS) profile domain-containing protein n=1 Tax=Alicyclobacillus ferrooxydans TaxID=471514 RepID=A0A0P9GUI8_9BACL|nr:MFS transporter [Alicyclobacillus ferrooxydans]KPV44931.1 hypothetical protein AN477_04805 [Alicyclobacillus ferrooxydans]